MPRKYYIVPLKNLVVFPGVVVPIFVGREKSILAIKRSITQKIPVLFCLQRLSVDDPKPKDLLPVGVLAEIVNVTQVDKKTQKIMINGQQRAVILKISTKQGVFEAEVDIQKDIDNLKNRHERTEYLQAINYQIEEYLKYNKNIPPDVFKKMLQGKQLEKLVFTIAHYLMFNLSDKQNLLAINNLKERCEFLMELLTREIEVIKLEDRLHSSIKDRIEKSQREYYLKEKVKAIQEELGESKESDVNDVQLYQTQIREAKLPDEVEKKAYREWNKLKRLSAVSAEAGIIKSYLEWLIEMPWVGEIEADYEVDNIKQKLNDHHYGLDNVKDRIEEFLAVYKQSKQAQGSILCLSGPSGVGKTSVARSIADVMGRKFIKISLGGMNDEAELRGHRRTYVGAMPGRIIQAIHQSGSRNPVILLDEIDKISKNYQSNPAAVLLEILDSEQNKQFYDYYLEVPFDLSDCIFIATANDTYNIPLPLLDRMEVIELSGYSLEEKITIAQHYLWQRILETHGISDKNFQLSDEVIEHIIMFYTKEAGLRELERSLSAIARKATLHLLQKKELPDIYSTNLNEYLGYAKYRHSLIPDKPSKGVVLGLAYTQRGGQIMPVEVNMFPGKGDIKMTGKMGDVMQESAQTAFSYVRSMTKQLGLSKHFPYRYDFHIHIPENAIPKDGPSAGLALTIVLISTMTGKLINHQLAMTGEITLHGDVLPIGGLKEKCLAAERVGIGTIIIPAGNMLELREIKKKYCKKLRVIAVHHVRDALKHVFVKSKKSRKKPRKTYNTWLS